MRVQCYALLLVTLLLPSLSVADALLMPGVVTKEELVKPFPQPYIVQQGDTLWDIADEYFADPEKWLKIWEQNLQVSNPDLIYPGHEVWIKLKEARQGGKVVKLQPRVMYKAVERSEVALSQRVVMALERKDFIQKTPMHGEGYVLDSKDDRLNYGMHDDVYLTLHVKAMVGDRFNIFRTGDVIYAPSSLRKGNDKVGYLIHHLGQVEVKSMAGDIYRATIVKAFAEIGRTDQLQRAPLEHHQLVPVDVIGSLQGQVIYIRDGAVEAGQGQVIGVNLGLKDGLQEGSVLSLYRAGRQVEDHIYQGGHRLLPEEKIGEMMILSPQAYVSMALITHSVAAVHAGDKVRARRGD